jgi:hypothetical protein
MSNHGRDFFNPAVAAKLDTQIFPPVGSMPREAMLLFVLDTVIAAGWGQDSQAATIR